MIKTLAVAASLAALAAAGADQARGDAARQQPPEQVAVA
jgi:hypothetical protein